MPVPALAHRSSSAADVLLPLLAPGAFAAGALTLAHWQPAAAAVETRYLALLGGVVLAGVALMASRRSRAPAAVALLATVALWVLPAGLPRAATFSVLLPSAVVVAAWERWRASRSRWPALPLAGGVLAVGALLRGPELLPRALDARAFLVLVTPAAVAVAVLALVERRRPGAALVAGVAVALAAGGFTAAAAAGLVAAAMLALLPAAWCAPLAAVPLLVALARHVDVALVRTCWPLLVLLPVHCWLAARGLLGASRRELALRLLAVALLAAGGVMILGGAPGIAAAVALLAMVAPEDGRATPLACGWLAALLLLGATATGYPWLRDAPLPSALALLGIHRGWLAAAAALVAAALLFALDIASPHMRHFAPLLLGGAVAVAILVAMAPVAGEALPADGIALTAAHPTYTVTLAEATAPRELRAVTTAAQTPSLPAGTRVATVTLDAGGTSARWELRTGSETGEWAARRPDLRGRAVAAPVAWAWLPPPGDFLGLAYRSQWQPPALAPGAVALRLDRDPALPRDVEVSVLRVQVSR